MKLLKIISLFVFTFFALVSTAQKKEIPTRYALCPGFNVSNLYNDSSRTGKATYPQIGFIFNKELNERFGFNYGAQFSLRGANSKSQNYKFRNTYFDFQFIPHITFFDFLKFQIGAQYSFLYSSKLLTRGIENAYEKKRIEGRYDSQLELMIGLELFIQKNISLNMKYTLPLKSMQYNNFQTTLNFYLTKESFLFKKKTKENVYGISLVNDGYVENDGLIYPAKITTPPQFDSGRISLYKFLEDSVRVLYRDYKDFHDDNFTFLVEMKIDTLGNINAIRLAESSTTSKVKGYQAGNISNEILKILNKMPKWKPAKINGKETEIIFYLPLNFQIDMKRIILQYPSQFLINRN